MTTLFRRIFLWFWVAMLAITLTTGAIIVGIAWERFALVGGFDSQQTVQSAQNALSQGGENGLRNWLRARTAHENGIALYVLDPAGHDLLGRDIPPVIRFAPPPWAGDEAHEHHGGHHHGFMGRHNHVLVSAQLDEPGHAPWWLIAAWAGSTPLDVLGTPLVWLATIALAVLLSSALCWVLARGISRPIVELQAHARQFAQGRFDPLIDAHLTARRDEIGQLAGEFNRMATQIQAQLASKEMLLRDISHELRSPLTRLRVAVGLAQAKGEKIDTYLERIERDIERLDRLIDDTLRFSMVATPGLSLPVETIDLVELVREALHDAEIEAEAKRLQLICPQAGPIPVPLNEDLFYRAVDNVLRNAIRHSPEGGTIAIRFAVAAAQVALEISDQGPGVPPEECERIFEAFYRVSTARERQTGGAGLGLALTARVAKLHGGTVEAHNVAPHGLMIVITLPLA